MRLPDLTLEVLPVDTRTAKFDLTLTLAGKGEHKCRCEYATDLFEAVTVARLLEHFRTLLAGLASEPEGSLADLPLLAEGERQQALLEWNDTAVRHPEGPGRCLHLWIAAQAERSPDVVALVFDAPGGTSALTYRGLDAEAACLARRLRRLGVGPEVTVAICLERSLELVVGLLGILKAGAAYLPLDASYPRERLAAMLEDSAAPVVLTDRRSVEKLPAHAGTTVFLGAPVSSALGADAGVQESTSADPDGLAYVIFTSGSTGRPKGVMNTHGAIVNRLLWMQEAYSLEPGDRVLQKTPISFDVSVWELFWPLLAGACLVVAQPDEHREPARLARTTAVQGITVLHFVPALLQAFLDEPEAARCASLRAVMASGEALPFALQQRFFAHLPGAALHNLYGPTEAAVDVTAWACRREGGASIVPLGRPIANTSVQVLDADLLPVPIGVPGELAIGGVQLARGYLGRPDLTAERFVPDPQGEPGGRRYRTGDLTRRLSGGEVEFLGRIDHQVKIRGLRIELGEIEAVLAGRPAVKEAVVVALAGISGAPSDLRLAAYLVLEPGGSAAEDPIGEIAEALRTVLPEFMVPATFTVLAALPRSPNGKVDRSQLPAPAIAGGGRLPSAGPHGAVEELIAGVFAAVLRTDAPGRGESFFSLGGHSLLAMQVVSRLRQIFECELSLRDLFEQPTVAGLAERLAEIGRTAGSFHAVPRLGALPAAGELPLSFAQERLWFVESLQPGSALYNIPQAFRLQGELRADLLERALQAVERRHEILRTVFTSTSGRPVQVVLSECRIRVPVVDLTALPPVAREEEAHHFLMQEVRRPFELSRGPLLRLPVVRLGVNEHIVLFIAHHLIFDGWSMGILMREVGALFSALLQGVEVRLPDLPAQYADFARWQRSWLQGEVLANQVDFWRQRLAGAPPILTLPLDRPRSAVRSGRGAAQYLPLPEALVDDLRRLGRRQGATLFMMLLAAFQAELSRYAGEQDLCVGISVAGRHRLETEPLIGFFVNTLVIRGDLTEDPDFPTLLGRVRGTTLEAQLHQDLPFASLVEELAPVRDLSHDPLVQVVFVFQNAPAPPLDLAGLSAAPLEVNAEVAKFDLMLVSGEREGGLTLGLDYSTDLFDRSTIARLLVQLRDFLAQAVAAPERRLSQFSWLTGAQWHQAISGWNDTATPLGGSLLVDELIFAQAARTPAAIAVSAPGGQLSYAELERQARSLANRLRALGVGPDVPVGLFLDRSAELLVALLGVLAAGGAYLPLDPEYPVERLAFLLADSRAPVLLTRSALVASVPATEALVVSVDAAAEEARETPAPIRPQPDNLAYILYTSGSTGQPKGVMASHRGVVAYLRWCAASYGLTFGSRSLVHSSFGFDLTVTTLLAPLVVGGEVVLPPEGEALEVLDQALRDERGYALLKLTPTHLEILGPELVAAAAGRVGTLILGGEALLGVSLSPWRAAAPTARILNEYGPTETVVGCCVHELPVEALPPGRVPIGRPIANARLYLVDRHLTPVPLGATGELLIGGAGVARGYRGRPDLTAERFLPDPFAVRPGERLYRTGDLARRLADGALDFLGRDDGQVKIRGFRIELGEIEVVLAGHPGCDEVAAILVREGGESRLVAFYTAADGLPTDGDLRSWADRRLPAYMIPALFVRLPEMPRTPHGKVDRRALQKTELVRSGGREEIAPRNPIESLLAQIWCEVLGLATVGVHDNFFELGGDSILSLQIASRARQAGFKITSRKLFQHQTIARLAAEVGAEPAPRPEPTLARSAQGFPLSPVQRDFFEQVTVDPHHYNQSILLTVNRPLHPAWLAAAVGRIARHHEALRLRFSQEEKGWVQRVSEDARVPCLHVDLASLPVAAHSAAVEAAAALVQTSLEPRQGVVLRVASFDLGSDRPWRLLFVAHHLVVDAVSWRILLEDLAATYESMEKGEDIVLPPVTTAFRDWVGRLQEHALSAIFQRELAPWLVTPVNAPLPLPVDHDRGPLTEASTRWVHRALDAEATRVLLQEVPGAYRTQINDALLTALAETLAEWTGSRSVLLDLEGHGREEMLPGLDAARTVGWFTAIFPVFLELPGKETLAADSAASLKVVKEQLRRITDGGVGYGLLRWLDGRPEIAERLRSLPTRQVSFNYFGQVDHGLPQASAFSPAPENAGPLRSPRQPRRYLLDINGRVVDGQLRLSWAYDERCHDQATIERLAEGFLGELRRLIAHCRTVEGGCTPSDFPLATLDQSTLDRLSAERRIEDIYSLSPLQKGLLFHSVFDPDVAEYVEQMTCRLDGELDLAAFEGAWQRVVERHAVLRTGFAWREVAEPVQIVEERASLPVARREAPDDIEALLAAERRELGDPSRPPLMRLLLIRLSDRCHRLIWTHHHILLDGWSMPLLMREVLAFYEAFRQGNDPIVERPRPYREYIEWLQGGQDRESAETLWRTALAGFTAATPLAIDRPARGLAGARSQATAERSLSAALTQDLVALARRLQVTLNTLVQGTWGALLSRYSGESDVVFGAVTAGRPADLVGADSMLGLFINTIPVRVRFEDGVPWATWLSRLQAEQIEVRRHEHAALSDIQGWSGIPRGERLFESLIAFENYPVDQALRTWEGSIEIREVVYREGTNYPLALVVSPGEALRLRAVYDPDRLDSASVARLLGHWQALLAALAARPADVPAAAPLLTEIERHQIVREWNDSAVVSRPEAQLLQELFEARVDRAPDAPAVLFGERTWSYAEIEVWANRWACHLRGLGVGPGSLVAVYLDRGWWMIPAVLAVLKAGGAYVPLDGNYPPQRVAWILSALKIRWLVSQGAWLAQLAGPLAELPRLKHVLCLDDEPAGAAAFGGKSIQRAVELPPAPRRLPPVAISPDDTAYIIFTSGSTGTPKGVVVQHRPVLNLIDWVNRTFQVGPSDRLLFITSLCFDLSVYDIFGVLAAGGSLRVASADDVRDPQRLVGYLLEDAITFWDSAPAALQQLTALLPTEPVAEGRLRLVFLSGDWIPVPLPDRVRAGFPGARVVALGGATEATIWSNFQRIRDVDPGWSSIPYGRPIQDARYHILDAGLEPCPIGVAGDLYIGGRCLSRGYAEERGLTASRFVPDPFADAPGSYLYQTGDRARHWADGTMEFLGRRDQQVKVRGFRIELGEVEVALGQHPEVRDAAVLVREDAPGHRRLVAYVVGQGEAAPGTATLREWLTRRLPDYMVPTAFVSVDELPVTPNGKLDRKALAALGMEPGAPQESGAPAPPRTRAEGALARIWAEVLRRERVGIHDNFFTLGGDSILSLQIISRAHQEGFHLTPRQLFERPTVAELAGLAGEAVALGVEAEPTSGPVALLPAQVWFFEQELADPQHYNQSLLLAAHQPLDADRLRQTLAELIRHHEALRLRFVHENGAFAAHVEEADDRPPLLVVDLATPDEAATRRQVENACADLQASLDLEHGPVLRAALLRAGGRADRLFLTVHHLAVDGVSWRILFDDLRNLYDALARGERPQLRRTTTIATWAERLAAHARQMPESEAAWWLAAAEAPAPLLPLDTPGGENTVASARGVAVELSRDETTALLQEVPPVYRTRIDDLLLTALLRTLRQWTGSRVLRLEMEGHGREDIGPGTDLSRTVGWLTSFATVRLELTLAGDPAADMKSIKEQLRAIPGRGLGSGLLRFLGGESAASRRLAPSPRPSISFDNLGQLDFADGEAFAPAPEHKGREISIRQQRPYQLKVAAGVRDGRMRIDWTYSENLHRQETVKRLAEGYGAALRELLAHCRAVKRWGCTPSDFPLAGLGQADLDRLPVDLRHLEDLYPLSSLQLGMLVQTLRNPGSGVYVQQLVCTLEGTLDVGIMERAWNRVAERHPVLRTSFVWDGLAEPLQWVLRQGRVPLEQHDWSELSSGDRERLLGELLARDRERGFELTQGPLLRLTLLRLGPHTHTLIWSHHHLLLDGWSLPLVVREIFTFYTQEWTSRQADLEAPQPFRSYIAWLRRQDPAQAEAFWRHELAGFEAPTPLGIDSPLRGASTEGVAPGERERSLPPARVAALQIFRAPPPTHPQHPGPGSLVVAARALQR